MMKDELLRGGLRVLVVVLNAQDAKRGEALFSEAGLPIQYRFRALGTASSEVTDLLGLEDPEKVMLLGFVPKMAAGHMLERLSYEFQMKQAGRGIAFTVPINGISLPAAKRLGTETYEKMMEHMDKEVISMVEGTQRSIVLLIANRGFSEEVMETARALGVSGGTVIPARRLGNTDAMQFWGIRVQDEKEIVAMLVPKEQKSALMKGISKQYGMHSEAQGFVVSLPVEDDVGL